jgi:NTE family protein
MEDVTIGLALGVGAARGWAHIGVIHGLVDIGIRPDVVCGTSAGALVGGSYAAGHIEELEEWLLSLDRLSVARFFGLTLTSGGLIAGKRIIGFMDFHRAAEAIEIGKQCVKKNECELTYCFNTK